MPVLKLVSLPIGNDKDITERSKLAIMETQLIIAEDTRVFRAVCSRIEISIDEKKVISFHDHSNEKELDKIVEMIKDTGAILVSDAGSPIISDPAYPLVKACLDQNIPVESLPGPSAVISALEVSGLPATPFHFHGFLPREKGKIETESEKFASQYGTHIFFEGVSRVHKTLLYFGEKFPDFQFVICRELTKTYESIYRFKGVEIAQNIDSIMEKGEFVILMHNDLKVGHVGSNVMDLATEVLESGGKKKVLSKLLSALTGKKAKEIYDQLK